MKSDTKSNKYCLLVRGKPCSGKSTITKSFGLIKNNFMVLDPDKINRKTPDYTQFFPRQTKNPTENVKMYCYLYNIAEKNLRSNQNIVWTQPWSRMAEIELTIRNFGYYLTNLKGKVWKSEIENILNVLPFTFLVAEISIDNLTSFERWSSLNNNTPKRLARLKKTQKLFQPFTLPTPLLKLRGTDNPVHNAKKLMRFVEGGN